MIIHLVRANSRLPILFHAFGYLTHDINFSIPLRSDFLNFLLMYNVMSIKCLELKRKLRKLNK